MTLRLTMEWPFVRREPSELEVQAQEAMARFAKAEKRALGRDSITELEDDIEGLVRDAEKLNGG